MCGSSGGGVSRVAGAQTPLAPLDFTISLCAFLKAVKELEICQAGEEMALLGKLV